MGSDHSDLVRADTLQGQQLLWRGSPHNTQGSAICGETTGDSYMPIKSGELGCACGERARSPGNELLEVCAGRK